MFSNFELFFIVTLISLLIVLIMRRRLVYIWEMSGVISYPPPEEAIRYGKERAGELLATSHQIWEAMQTGKLKVPTKSSRSYRITKFEWMIINLLKFFRHRRTEGYWSFKIFEIKIKRLF